jgi:hypothetical protein
MAAARAPLGRPDSCYKLMGNVALVLSLILICINSMTAFYYVQHPKHAAVFSFLEVTFK